MADSFRAGWNGTEAGSDGAGPGQTADGTAGSQKQEQPAWAKRMHRRQQATHAATTAAHTLRGGDGGGARPEPAGFRYLTFKENTHAIQTTAGALRRYAAACHPYQAAAQVWDDRIGSARVQAKNWRLMAFGCLVLALLMAGGLVWRSAQSIVTPYVIEVDQAGQVRAVGEAATPYRPGDAQIAHHLARFVTLVRSLSIDPIVVRQNWLDAYDYTTDKGAAVLNDYARTNDPFARIGKESVTVQITSVVRASVRLSTCAGQSSAMSTVRPPAPNAGTPCFRPSCKPRVLNSACSRTHWVSTSTACHGAANWILPKGKP